MKTELKDFFNLLNDAVSYLCLVLLGVFIGLLFLFDNADLLWR